MSNETIRISILEVDSSVAELEEIQKLRYQIYIEELGYNLAGSDHKRRLLTDMLDVPAIHIAARIGSALVGAVRLNIDAVPAGLEAALEAAFLPKPFVYCSRLSILKSIRKGHALPALIGAAFQQFYRHSAAVAICHCYPTLFKLYERLGFQRYGTSFIVPGLEELGAQTPFRCWLQKQGEACAA